MPLEGQAKKDNSFVRTRTEKDKIQYWFKVCKRADKMFRGYRYKSEVLSYVDLFRLYFDYFYGYSGITEAIIKEERPEDKKKEEDEPQLKGDKKEKKGKTEKKKEPLRLKPYKARRLLSKTIGNFEDGKFEHYTNFHEDGYLDFHDWLRARDQARKDLFFLAKSVLRHSLLKQSVHKQVCDLFVQKDFDHVYFEGYAKEVYQDAIKTQDRVPTYWNEKRRLYMPVLNEAIKPENKAREMILLFPRFFFKSTINMVDCAQWLLNCPDVSILIMTAKEDHATDFMMGVKKFFYLPTDAEVAEPFHLLFPEYVIRNEDDGISSSPLVHHQRRHSSIYPSVAALAIASTGSGRHCDIFKCDDVVSNKNCNTEATRKQLFKDIQIAKNIPNPWGWIDFIGTRYFVDDYYGATLAAYTRNPDKVSLKFFSAGTWVIKPEYKDIEKEDLKRVTEDMVTLLYPEYFPFSKCQAIIFSDDDDAGEDVFRCQQLNQPALDKAGWGFDADKLRAAIINYAEAFDKPGYMVAAWDTAKTANRNSDYTVGVVGKVIEIDNEGTKALIVMDVVCEKLTQRQVAEKVVEMDTLWRPFQTIMENTGGLERMFDDIQMISMRTNGRHILNFYLETPSNEPDAKKNRIRGLYLLLLNKQLFFSEDRNHSWNDEAITQFVRFTGVKGNMGRKDDIPDALSYLCRYVPCRTFKMTPREIKEADEARLREMEISHEQKVRAALAGNYQRTFGMPMGEIFSIRPWGKAEEEVTEDGPLDGLLKKFNMWKNK